MDLYKFKHWLEEWDASVTFWSQREKFEVFTVDAKSKFQRESYHKQLSKNM